MYMEARFASLGSACPDRLPKDRVYNIHFERSTGSFLAGKGTPAASQSFVSLPLKVIFMIFLLTYDHYSAKIYHLQLAF